MKKATPGVFCACGKPLEECDCMPASDATLFSAAELGLDPEEDDAYISVQPVHCDRRDL